MAIMDALASFAYRQDIPAVNAGADTAFGDVYDTWAESTAVYGGTGQNRQLGDGSPIYVNVMFNTAFTNVSSGAFSIHLNHDDALSGNSLVAKNRLFSYAVGLSASAGDQFSMIIPVGKDVQRYMELSFNTTGSANRGNNTNGLITAWLDIKPIETRKLYVEGRNWV